MAETGSDGAVVVHTDTGVIETSYSCVVVRSWSSEALVAVAPDENTLVTVPDGEESIGDLWVNTADQWGPFSVETRLWSGPPPDPGAEWEDVVELSVTSTTGLAATEMVDNDPQIVLAPEPGDYRLRVSARGRRIPDIGDDDDLDLDGEQPPKEWYLLEAWPAPAMDPAVVRLTSPFAEHVLNPPAPLVIPDGEAGLAAAGRIGRDVDRAPGARELSGATGSVRVERTIRGTRRRLFNLCAHVGSWSATWTGLPGWSAMSGPGWDEAGGSDTWKYSGDSRDQLTGHGAVRTRFLVLESPARAVKTWNWVRRVGDRGPSPLLPGSTSEVLAEDSTFTVELTQSRDDSGEPLTTITITHDGLPVEWLDDMETYWAYQLSIADHAGFGIPT